MLKRAEWEIGVSFIIHRATLKQVSTPENTFMKAFQSEQEQVVMK